MKKIPKMSLEQYSELAGAEWPSFSDYIKGNITSKLIKLEISYHERQIYNEDKKNRIKYADEYNLKYKSFNKRFFIKYFLLVLFPAIVGTGLYFYLGGTLTKFLILFLCFRFLNILYTQVMHRWLCHHMFEPKKWARPFLLWIVVAGCHSHTGNWIRGHWSHHQDDGTELDPYPPSWGLLKLAFIVQRYWRPYPFGRWMTAPDIKFVLRNICWLWLINAAIFAYIDIDIFLLSFLFIQVYANLDDGISNFLLHDGFRTQQPVNFPVFGYFGSLFVAIESVHIVHTTRPWIFNQAKNVPGAIDLGYLLMKPFAASERE
jgi:hypothetical protein